MMQLRREVLGLLIGDVDALEKDHPETYRRLMEWRLPSLDKTK